MEQVIAEIAKVNSKIDAIEEMLDKDYEEWTTREKNKFGNHEQLRKKEEQLRKKEEQLRKKKEQLRELLILKEKEKQNNSSRPDVGFTSASQDMADQVGPSIISVRSDQIGNKSIYSCGPVDPINHYLIPLDMLPWGKDLLQAVDNQQAILLHGHWQSGKTSALRYIQIRAEEKGIKVYHLDLMADFNTLKLFFASGYSIFQFFASRMSSLPPECLPNFMSCVDFCIWVSGRHQGHLAPILLIDEYDAFLKFGREDPRFLLQMNNLISYNRNTQNTFSSIVCAGTFSIVATQTGDMDAEADITKEDSDDSLDTVVRHFDVVSPWNKAHFIETRPFERQLFKDFSLFVYKKYRINIEADIVDDILETACGHPGFSIWLLIKSIQQSIGQEYLSTVNWMNSKRSLYYAELYKTPTMRKMLVKVKSSKKIARVLHVLVRDNQVYCEEARLVSFLRAVGIAKLSYHANLITFTSPIIRDCLLQEFYPTFGNIEEIIILSHPTPANFMQTVLLIALRHIKVVEILDPLVTYSKGLAEAAIHAELYRILHAFFRNQSAAILTETRVVTSSDMRCDIWIKTLLTEFGLELKTERDNNYIQKEANLQIVKYVSSREPREMVLVNFVMKEAASVTFPININPIGWEKYPNTTFTILFVKIVGDVVNGLKFYYALNGDIQWSDL